MMLLYDTKYNLTQDNDIKVKNKNVTHYIMIFILICFIAVVSVVILQIILQNVMVQIVNLQNVVGPVL